MAITSGVSLFRSREEILDDMLADLQTLIPDAYVGQDGVIYILFSIFAGVMESLFVNTELLRNDVFVETASEDALDRRGTEKGVPRLPGVQATGNLLFSGDGGVPIDIETEVAYDPGTGADFLYFTTVSAATIPNPGAPTAPDVALNATAGNLTGSFEYVITFLTAAGETLAGAESAAIVCAAQQVDLSTIPLGGTGTTGRRIYRQKDGSGAYNFVDEIADNVTTTYTDNIADGALGGNPPAVSTAERVTVPAQAEEAGSDYNVAAGTITILTNAPDGVVAVTNPAPFSGATDPEGFEDFRVRLGEAVKSPQTGAPGDIQVWAEEVDGVESATVFANDNEGVATNGHTTVRIAGPNGTVPDAGVISAVQTALDTRDLANVTIHVTTFVPTSTDVGVTLTLAAGYTHADVDSSVISAITNYINSLQVGETFRTAGVYSAVFGLAGVTDLTVDTPATNLATGSTAKRTPGTITVS
ncbi:MAG TPA: baseplate J/gp47 family protein [Nitrospira sp.]|nr:baseplate J/gp47 family protein [Nitrospira sp.]